VCKAGCCFLGELVEDWFSVEEACMGRLSGGQRALVLRLRAQGLSLRQIAAQVGCSHETVSLITRDLLGKAVREWDPGPGRLGLADREEISRGLARGESLSTIAAGLGRSPGAISREIARNGGRQAYRALGAHRRAFEQARRPKGVKLAYAPLAEKVGVLLAAWWSPQQIARRLRIEHEDDPMMQVSHETIYQSLFVQGRGELRRELARCLRSGRTVRKPHGTGRRGGQVIRDMVMISERPVEVADRAVPGHWEGDLILGADGRSQVGTLVERTTRYVMLLHLPTDRAAATVEAAMRQAIASLPAHLFKSITWDQGAEMALHRRFTAATGIDVYFCDPRSPWQRGSNENTNGLLRQYLPKGTDLSVHTAEDLAAIAHSLNGRPRMTLDWMTPSDKLAELLAHTT
jgi:transposase, IS30 family